MLRNLPVISRWTFPFSDHCHSHNFLWQLFGPPWAWKLLGKIWEAESSRYAGGQGSEEELMSPYQGNLFEVFKKQFRTFFIAGPKYNLKIWRQAPVKVPEVEVKTCILGG